MMSPGSMRVLQTRSITCWPPVVTSTSSGSTIVPSSAITSAMQLLSTVRPSVGPYCSDRAVESTATLLMIAAKDSDGNEAVSGSPPASEMMSLRSVSAMRSRIAEDFMTFVRAAKSPA
jgi:hypothetical protein